MLPAHAIPVAGRMRQCRNKPHPCRHHMRGEQRGEGYECEANRAMCTLQGGMYQFDLLIPKPTRRSPFQASESSYTASGCALALGYSEVPECCWAANEEASLIGCFFPSVVISLRARTKRPASQSAQLASMLSAILRHTKPEQGPSISLPPELCVFQFK
jgi:hypothetical protein